LVGVRAPPSLDDWLDDALVVESTESEEALAESETSIVGSSGCTLRRRSAKQRMRARKAGSESSVSEKRAVSYWVRKEAVGASGERRLREARCER
jgi:hypothetical protein